MASVSCSVAAGPSVILGRAGPTAHDGPIADIESAVMTTTSNIARWVSRPGGHRPGLPAIKQGEKILSYGALDGASARFAPCWPSAG